jgi:hypothetical protein
LDRRPEASVRMLIQPILNSRIYSSDSAGQEIECSVEYASTVFGLPNMQHSVPMKRLVEVAMEGK